MIMRQELHFLMFRSSILNLGGVRSNHLQQIDGQTGHYHPRLEREYLASRLAPIERDRVAP